jgi:hypothetical protein
MNLSRNLFNYSSDSKTKIHIGGMMLDQITNNLLKAAGDVVELYTKNLHTSKKMLSVDDIDKNHVRNE